MKAITLLFNVLIFSQAFAQNNQGGLNKDSSHTWVIKGITLPYFLGNNAGIAFSLGGEYWFLKNQSIGIDGFINLAEGSREDIADTAGIVHDVGGYYHTTEKAIFLNYRYYFGSNPLRNNSDFALYVSTYFRYGHRATLKDELYPEDYITKIENSWSQGILIGSVSALDQSKRFYFDVNAGPFFKEKNINTTYREAGIIKSSNEKPSAIGVRIGIYICYFIPARR